MTCGILVDKIADQTAFLALGVGRQLACLFFFEYWSGYNKRGLPKPGRGTAAEKAEAMPVGPCLHPEPKVLLSPNKAGLCEGRGGEDEKERYNDFLPREFYRRHERRSATIKLPYVCTRRG